MHHHTFYLSGLIEEAWGGGCPLLESPLLTASRSTLNRINCNSFFGENATGKKTWGFGEKCIEFHRKNKTTEIFYELNQKTMECGRRMEREREGGGQLKHNLGN